MNKKFNKKIDIALIYNEPTVTTPTGRKFISETGVLYSSGGIHQNDTDTLIDMSEVAVLDEMNDIKRALEVMGHSVTLFNVDSDIYKLIDFLRYKKPDLIFNICESIGNESIHEMHVAGIFELLGIPYTGANAFTLGLAQNKMRVKEILSYHNLPTPKFRVIKNPSELEASVGLNFPIIVKPSREDASVGITNDSVVYNFDDLKSRVHSVIEKFTQPALIEEYIDGREINVAIIGNSNPTALPVSEVDMSTLPDNYHKIITYNAKWMKGTDEFECTKGVCPAPLPEAVAKKLQAMALKVYNIIGCRDYARVDFRLTKEYQPYILEVNPNPDIAADAGFARAAKAAGMTFEEMTNKIVELALERCQ